MVAGRGFSNIADISAKLLRYWGGDVANVGQSLQTAGANKPPEFGGSGNGGNGNGNVFSIADFTKETFSNTTVEQLVSTIVLPAKTLAPGRFLVGKVYATALGTVSSLTLRTSVDLGATRLVQADSPGLEDDPTDPSVFQLRYEILIRSASDQDCWGMYGNREHNPLNGQTNEGSYAKTSYFSGASEDLATPLNLQIALKLGQSVGTTAIFTGHAVQVFG